MLGVHSQPQLRWSLIGSCGGMEMWDNCDMENVNKHTVYLSLSLSLIIPHLCVLRNRGRILMA